MSDLVGLDRRRQRAQSLVGTSKGRPADDYYPTPPLATEALLASESFTGSIWEPACGDGSMSKVLIAHGHDVASTDLIDRGYGEAPHDFLTSTRTATNIVTNPPFTLAESFVRLALARSTGKVAMLCKIQFLEGLKRRALFESTPLKAVWVFSKRLTLRRNGVAKTPASGMLCFAWYVWMHGHVGAPTIGWL
jgi:hypothetical protein